MIVLHSTARPEGYMAHWVDAMLSHTDQGTFEKFRERYGKHSKLNGILGWSAKWGHLGNGRKKRVLPGAE